MKQGRGRLILGVLLFVSLASVEATPERRVPPKGEGLLATEKVPGRGVWVDPFLTKRLEKAGRVRATVWFGEQLLGDGKAYRRRAQTFRGRGRRELRDAVVRTLKALSARTWKKVEARIAKLVKGGGLRAVERHWIINGFSCGVTPEGLADLVKLPGVRKVFGARIGWPGPKPPGAMPVFPKGKRRALDAKGTKRPWYVRSLLADKVWKRFGVTGEGTLNVIHDFNFLYSPNLTPNAYRHPGEIPGNGKDDDGNGLVDDTYGFNFDHATGALTTAPVGPQATDGPKMHGFMCSAIICGTAAKGRPYAFGIAPEAHWAGVISSRRLEAAIEWAIEQKADTYSMSFSKPGEGEYRSHRRKVMEQASLCGVYFVSGAGNFAKQVEVPVQMRQPEDIPEVVFSAAGVQRDLSRTAFSSKGPVLWETEHYHDGLVDKPEVCAFNANLPYLRLDGTVTQGGLGGNSFAGPMFCGSIALMLSADPDLLPWDLKEIITGTAMDVAAKGYDHETGHGLINCFRAVKEVLRRKAKREGKSTKPFEGREKGDELDVKAAQAEAEISAVYVTRVGSKGQAKALGVEVGDVLVSYAGRPIHKRADLMAAKQAAGKKAGAKEVPVVLKRGRKTLKLTFQPGRLGIGVGGRTKGPVFQ